MKRVRIAPGKFVMVSPAIAAKAARVFATGVFSRDQINEIAKMERDSATGLMAGAKAKYHNAPTKHPRINPSKRIRCDR